MYLYASVRVYLRKKILARSFLSKCRDSLSHGNLYDVTAWFLSPKCNPSLITYLLKNLRSSVPSLELGRHSSAGHLIWYSPNIVASVSIVPNNVSSASAKLENQSFSEHPPLSHTHPLWILLLSLTYHLPCHRLLFILKCSSQKSSGDNSGTYSYINSFSYSYVTSDTTPYIISILIPFYRWEELRHNQVNHFPKCIQWKMELGFKFNQLGSGVHIPIDEVEDIKISKYDVLAYWIFWAEGIGEVAGAGRILIFPQRKSEEPHVRGDLPIPGFPSLSLKMER